MYICLLKEMREFTTVFIEDYTKYLSPRYQLMYAKMPTERARLSVHMATWQTYVESYADYFTANYASASSWSVKPIGQAGRNWGALLPWADPVINKDIFLDFDDPIAALSTLIHEPQHNIDRRWLGHRNEWDTKLSDSLYAAESWAKFSPWPNQYCCHSDREKMVKTYWDHFLCKCGFLDEKKKSSLKMSWEEFKRLLQRANET
jgi:hypothetical protein